MAAADYWTVNESLLSDCGGNSKTTFYLNYFFPCDWISHLKCSTLQNAKEGDASDTG